MIETVIKDYADINRFLTPITRIEEISNLNLAIRFFFDDEDGDLIIVEGNKMYTYLAETPTKVDPERIDNFLEDYKKYSELDCKAFLVSQKLGIIAIQIEIKDRLSWIPSGTSIEYWMPAESVGTSGKKILALTNLGDLRLMYNYSGTAGQYIVAAMSSKFLDNLNEDKLSKPAMDLLFDILSRYSNLSQPAIDSAAGSFVISPCALELKYKNLEKLKIVLNKEKK